LSRENDLILQLARQTGFNKQ